MPEAKAPKGILDCIAAVHFIFEELLARFNVDSKRLCLNGESSGGYLAVGIMMELAKTGEADTDKASGSRRARNQCPLDNA